MNAIKQVKKISNDYPCEVDMDFEINNIIEIYYKPDNLKELCDNIKYYYITFDMCETKEEKEEIIKNLRIIYNFYNW